MKRLLVILPALFLLKACLVRPTENIVPEENKVVVNKQIDFDKEVMPIFVKNCSPCHFTGGKMYDRLPFDKDTTFLNHSQAILKRIKNKEENQLLTDFALQNKK